MFDPQRHAVLWMLVGFIVTTAATRAVTRFIRHKANQAEQYLKEKASPGLIRNMMIAGIHIHHQVWGILILLFTGLLMFAYTPEHGLVLNIMGYLFGMGAALTLDEFAMWLHVEDVYWKEEGRSSISALIVAVVITAAMAVGADPFDVAPAAEGHLNGMTLAVLAVINGGLVIGTILKGKLNSGLIGIFVPFVALIGFIRLAKPGSWWANRRYAPGGVKDRRAHARFDASYEKRWNAIRDLIGGPPDKRPRKAPRRGRGSRRYVFPRQEHVNQHPGRKNRPAVQRRPRLPH